MFEAINTELKKIIFSRNKKNPTISERDKAALNDFINNKMFSLLNSGMSSESATILLESAISFRIFQLSEIKNNYKSYSKKDTYTSFIDNLINIHNSVIHNIKTINIKE